MAAAMVAMAAALICMLLLACAPFAQAAAADAKCTGTPTACDARLNKCARGCERKSALVTSGAGVPGAFACSGTPTACEAMESRDACTLQGCQWEDDEDELCTRGFKCTGAPPTCSGTFNGRSRSLARVCATPYDGCVVDVVTTGFLTVSYCVGTPKPCASMESEAACKAQRCSVSKCEDTNSVGPGVREGLCGGAALALTASTLAMLIHA